MQQRRKEPNSKDNAANGACFAYGESDTAFIFCKTQVTAATIITARTNNHPTEAK